ncbi:MAG: sulfatase-like hydrolase/transferase, partial [bacterium]|nr:sulfatase-like hydrolase/transferase [bacterium]
QSSSQLAARLGEMGGTTSYPHYSAGWAWATNTPFQWVKQVASHLGGTRNPLVVSWPKKIREGGSLRTQFSHVIDVVPTVLDAIGLTAPTHVNGVAQQRMDGTSFLYSFEDAKAEERHQTQYFEIYANRALYHRGWIASARNKSRVPWQDLTSGGSDTLSDDWELYDLHNDFSQAHDLAAQEPQMLRKLQNLFWAEAGRNQVLPLSPRPASVPAIPPLGAGRSAVAYHTGAVGLPESAVPNLKNRDHTISARIVVPEGGARGVLATQGGVGAGWSLYLTPQGQPAYVYNLFGKTVTTIVGPTPLPAGPTQLVLRFDYDGGGYGKGASLQLLANGERVAEGRLEASVPGFFSIDETFDVGTDTGSPAGDYPANFDFSGRIDGVTLEIEG